MSPLASDNVFLPPVDTAVFISLQLNIQRFVSKRIASGFRKVGSQRLYGSENRRLHDNYINPIVLARAKYSQEKQSSSTTSTLGGENTAYQRCKVTRWWRRLKILTKRHSRMISWKQRESLSSCSNAMHDLDGSDDIISWATADNTAAISSVRMGTFSKLLNKSDNEI